MRTLLAAGFGPLQIAIPPGLASMDPPFTAIPLSMLPEISAQLREFASELTSLAIPAFQCNQRDVKVSKFFKF